MRRVMASDLDDAELIARSLDGDVDAFVDLVRRHEAKVGAYLARRVGRELAEDLLGEVWVAALGSRTTYDRSFRDAGPWLLRSRCSRRSPGCAPPAPMPASSSATRSPEPGSATSPCPMTGRRERSPTGSPPKPAAAGLRPGPWSCSPPGRSPRPV